MKRRSPCCQINFFAILYQSMMLYGICAFLLTKQSVDHTIARTCKKDSKSYPEDIVTKECNKCIVDWFVMAENSGESEYP